jgi:proteasome regulatory subunit
LNDKSRQLLILKNQISDLLEDSQQLLTEKLFLENEINQLKKRSTKLEEEIRSLRMPPNIIGFIQDLEGDKAIVRSSNGTVFMVSINPTLNKEKLLPGARVSLNQDTLAIISILDDAFDPLVTSTEILEKTDIEYSDLGGLEKEIKLVRDAIELPFEKPDIFKEFGIIPPKGILLSGPPGTGKTMLAKAVANATNATFLGLVGSELAQKYIGEGGRMVRELFDLARKKSPTIIFIDEIDAIGSKRLDASTSGDREVQRTLMQLLAEMDGFDALENVKIIAATNRPELLDKALLRPGRFDRIIEIPLPDLSARKQIFDIHLANMPISQDVKSKKLSIITEGFSGAEIQSVTIEAGMSAITDNKDKCSMSDFKTAVSTMLIKKKQSALSEPDRLYG